MSGGALGLVRYDLLMRCVMRGRAAAWLICGVARPEERGHVSWLLCGDQGRGGERVRWFWDAHRLGRSDGWPDGCSRERVARFASKVTRQKRSPLPRWLLQYHAFRRMIEDGA